MRDPRDPREMPEPVQRIVEAMARRKIQQCNEEGVDPILFVRELDNVERGKCGTFGEWMEGAFQRAKAKGG